MPVRTEGTIRDGKQVVILNPCTEGWATWFSGAGDDIQNGTRGDGQKILISFSGTGSEGNPEIVYVDMQFIEPVEVHDGELNWKPVDNFSANDRFSFSVIMNATPSESAQGNGNANKVSIGSGMNIIVPAAGNGSYNIDLGDGENDFGTVVPIPNDANTGYWNICRSTGKVSIASPSGTGTHDLFDFQLESFFLKNMPCGSPMGVFAIDAYKVEWIHPNWKLRLKGFKETASSGKISGWLMCFRLNTR